jgi:ATP-binding cassette, subfamily B, bacterial
MKAERASAAEAIRSVLMILRSSFAAAPGRTAAALVIYPLGYLETPFVALGLRAAADAAVSGDPGGLAVAVAVLLTAFGVFNILDHTAWQLCLDLEDRVGLVLDRRIAELVSAAPGLEHFERPEYADRLEILRERGWMLGRAMYGLPMNFADIVRAGLTFTLLAAVHPLLLLLPLFGVPSVLVDSRRERRQREVEESCVDSIRRARHVYELSTSAAPGKEIRVFGLAGLLRARHRGEWLRVHGAQARARWSATVGSTLAWLFFAAGFVAAAWFVAGRVLAGTASIGDLVLTLTLAAQVNAETRVAIELVAWSQWVARIGSHLLWLEDSARRRQPASDGSRLPPATLSNGITFEGVSFGYPGTERRVLTDVDLHLPAGSTVAIVGENGAGKTTLVKLLCRFYEPTAGRILVDGEDLREMDREGWLRRVTASFQDFFRFELVARESIGIGDLPFKDDEARIRRAVAEADAQDVVSALPRGLETRLGALWPDGTELSIGQWQKMALARSLMRTSPLLLILDEPTASLDPQTEHALFERRTQAAARARGAVTVLVSHRFSTVARADLIVVVAGGRIVEQGSHGELMASAGLYADLYSLQARAYRPR